ncbi:MAG: hypothetical protein M3R04_00955, partial [bacterium]|nr:hypothetical protein [bacterium]
MTEGRHSETELLALVLSLEEQVNENEQRMDNAMRNLVELARAVRSMVLKVEEQQARLDTTQVPGVLIGTGNETDVTNAAMLAHLQQFGADFEYMSRRLSTLELSQQQTELELSDRHSALEQRLESRVMELATDTASSDDNNQLRSLFAELEKGQQSLAARMESITGLESRQLASVSPQLEFLSGQQELLAELQSQMDDMAARDPALSADVAGRVSGLEERLAQFLE